MAAMTGHYKTLLIYYFFFFFFSAPNRRGCSLGRSSSNFDTNSTVTRAYETESETWGHSPENWHPKKTLKFGRFPNNYTTHRVREYYLLSGTVTKYRQTENGVENCDHSSLLRMKLCCNAIIQYYCRKLLNNTRISVNLALTEL